MVHQIGADGIVFVQSKRNFYFRADTVDACHKYRLTHPGKTRAKQSAEPADFSKDLSGGCRMSFLHKRLNLVLQSIAEIDVHARARVRLFLLCHSERSRGISVFNLNSKRFLDSAARCSRFSMMNLSNAGSTGRG